MSIQALDWAFRQNLTTKGKEKLVLVALANYANDDGFCYPSISTLCEMVSAERNTICKAISYLIEQKLIEKTNDMAAPRYCKCNQNVYKLLVRKCNQFENRTSSNIEYGQFENDVRLVRALSTSSSNIIPKPLMNQKEPLMNPKERNACEKNSHAHAQKTTTENFDKNSRFKKPTTDEIQTYVNQQNLINFDTRHFFDHYESNGWIVGKTKMKSWQHAVQNWHRRSHKFDNHNGSNAKNQSQSVPRNDLEGNSDYYNDLDQIPF